MQEILKETNKSLDELVKDACELESFYFRFFLSIFY